MTRGEEREMDTMQVRVRWEAQSRSSKGKWAYRAIEALKAAGATYEPATKLWTVPEDVELYQGTWDEIEIVEDL